MEIEQALKATGFVKCTFGPDSDPCDNCDKTHRQHYFRSSSAEYPDDGEYLCSECVMLEAKENATYKVE